MAFMEELCANGVTLWLVELYESLDDGMFYEDPDKIVTSGAFTHRILDTVHPSASANDDSCGWRSVSASLRPESRALSQRSVFEKPPQEPNLLKKCSLLQQLWPGEKNQPTTNPS